MERITRLFSTLPVWQHVRSINVSGFGGVCVYEIPLFFPCEGGKPEVFVSEGRFFVVATLGKETPFSLPSFRGHVETPKDFPRVEPQKCRLQ